MNKIKTISTTLANGTKINYNVILTFKSTISNKNYVVYTDNTIDSGKKLRIYAVIYNPDFISPFIEEPTTKEEWSEITRVIDTVIPAK